MGQKKNPTLEYVLVGKHNCISRLEVEFRLFIGNMFQFLDHPVPHGARFDLLNDRSQVSAGIPLRFAGDDRR